MQAIFFQLSKTNLSGFRFSFFFLYNKWVLVMLFLLVFLYFSLIYI